MSYSLPVRSRPVDDLLTCIEYWFDDKYKDDDENWPSGKFLVRGGICWPDRYDTATDSVLGCAVLAAYNLGTDVAYVWECQPFACIDHIVDPVTRAVTHVGLAQWFNLAFSRYMGDTFYVWQPDDTRARWESEVRNCPTIQTPPRFVPAPEWGDVARGEALLWEWLTRKRLAFFAKSGIDAAIKGYRKGEEKQLPGPLHAMACCLSGMSGQISGALEVSRAPQSLVGKINNRLMLDHKRDWRGN